jgi:hypothetical protein
VDWTRAGRLLLCLAGAPALMASKCDQPLVKDSGFDLWCGDTLCDWQVDAGSVAKVPTWNEHDYGVGLVGSDARISQLLPYTDQDVSCVHVQLLADVADTVNVTLTLDFDDDGTPEHTEVIPAGAWTPLSYRVTAPTYFHGVRIAIQKQGDGEAALAQIAAASSDGCTAPPPTGDLGRPAGATCEVAAQCADGRCLARPENEELIPDPSTVQMACEACAADGDCAAGSVCGLAYDPAFYDPHRACVPAAAAVLGARCLGDGECATGVCCRGVCSVCCGGDATAPACASGDACAQPAAGDAGAPPFRRAWQCAPGAGHAAAGAACLADADCAGGRCAGAGPLQVCAADGRPCAADADCPGGAPQNSCIAIGVAGGKCQ